MLNKAVYDTKPWTEEARRMIKYSMYMIKDTGSRKRIQGPEYRILKVMLMLDTE